MKYKTGSRGDLDSLVCGVKDSEIFNENGATFFQSAKDKEGLETQPANQRSFGILCVWGFQMKKMRE